MADTPQMLVPTAIRAPSRWGSLSQWLMRVVTSSGPPSGGVPDLKKTYEAEKFPGMLDTERPWKKYPEWADGFRHLTKGPSEVGFRYLLRFPHPLCSF